MKKIALLGVFCVLFSGPASADNSEIALQLGSILAAEEFCELTYNQDAIVAYIEKRVDDSDMGFASLLKLMTDGSAYDLNEMSDAAKAAHCAQIRRVAKKYKFISE